MGYFVVTAARRCAPEVAFLFFVFLRFAELLPSFASDEHRQGEISNLIAAFWKMLQDVGADLSAFGVS